MSDEVAVHRARLINVAASVLESLELDLWSIVELLRKVERGFRFCTARAKRQERLLPCLWSPVTSNVRINQECSSPNRFVLGL